MQDHARFLLLCVWPICYYYYCAVILTDAVPKKARDRHKVEVEVWTIIPAMIKHAYKMSNNKIL